MTRNPRAPTWAWTVAGIGLALIPFAFVPLWLTHHREVTGEGVRTLVIGLSAWQLRSVPVVSAGVVTALVVGLAAVALPRIRPWLIVAIAVPLGILAASVAPLTHVGHVNRVWITPGWALLPAIAGVASMAALAIRGARPTSRGMMAAAAVFLVVGAGAVGGRALQLELQEAVRVHWSDGTYDRELGGTRLALTLRDGTYDVDDWSGTMEPAGINVLLTGDPACPDARGLYMVRNAGGEDMRWEKIVDVCADGARSEALAGVWQRGP